MIEDLSQKLFTLTTLDSIFTLAILNLTALIPLPSCASKDARMSCSISALFATSLVYLAFLYLKPRINRVFYYGSTRLLLGLFATTLVKSIFYIQLLNPSPEVIGHLLSLVSQIFLTGSLIYVGLLLALLPYFLTKPSNVHFLVHIQTALAVAGTFAIAVSVFQMHTLNPQILLWLTVCLLALSRVNWWWIGEIVEKRMAISGMHSAVISWKEARNLYFFDEEVDGELDELF